MTRRYGPTRGAGTRIEEQDGDKSIEPGALGWAGYGGIMERGDVGTLMLITGGATEFAKRCGSIIPESQLPDAAQDYFGIARGAGGLALVRVTDGNELAAKMTLYARIAGVLTPMGELQAKNGGRWGGKRANVSADMDALGDLADTTLQLPAAIAADFTTDQLKGATLVLSDVPNTSYPVTGNTDTGLVSVATDQTMLADHSGGADLRFYLALANGTKAVSVILRDGEDNSDTEFALEVFVDGSSVKTYGNLHTDPENARYWVDIVNDDDGNYEIFAVDNWTGAHVANVRPANHYGLSSALTATILTADIHDFTISSPIGLGDPMMALGATTDEQLEQQLVITMVDATTGNVVSSKFGALGLMTLGTEFDSPGGLGGADLNKWIPPFTVSAGGTPLVAADVLTINYKPFVADSLINGSLYPDKVGSKRDFFRIVDNDHKTITVSTGSDMLAVAAAMAEFMVAAALQMELGRDGNADIVDSSYEQQAWSIDTSPFNDVEGKNIGILKFATPGVTSTSVQKAGVAFAEGTNHQYRYECPANITTENGAIGLVNDTLGRSDYAVMAFPSYGSVPHPDPASAREGKLKLVTQTGQIHGREARIASDFDGYHKAEAGIDAVLNRTLKLPTGDRKLNEELLNPAGIQVLRKKKGNFVIWGDRTLHRDPQWRFKHHREQMSYYEQVLQESFDFIIFAINDTLSDKSAETALITFFLPEFVKRAVRGKTFQEAVIIAVDEELNTDATRGAADKIASVNLQLADTTERMIIRIGKQGIFEEVA